jgi:hypothetical protein
MDTLAGSGLRPKPAVIRLLSRSFRNAFVVPLPYRRPDDSLGDGPRLERRHDAPPGEDPPLPTREQELAIAIALALSVSGKNVMLVSADNACDGYAPVTEAIVSDVPYARFLR